MRKGTGRKDFVFDFQKIPGEGMITSPQAALLLDLEERLEFLYSQLGIDVKVEADA